jgi:nucleoside-diphosphate-sugar epimerase
VKREAREAGHGILFHLSLVTFHALRLNPGMRALVIGCGYVGLPLAAELARQGHDVFGVRRGTAGDDALKAAGVHPLVADITRPETLAALPRDFDWVVNCVASGGGGAGEYRRVYLDGTRHLLQWLAPQPLRAFVYTSSTSVYGQNDGRIVDEKSPTEPDAETARVLVETEGLLLRAAGESHFPAIVLRVAGIYGPGRGHWFQQFLKNEARLEGDGGRMLNMIHRDDVVGAIIAALKQGRPGEIYNAVDDQPVSQRDFFEWLGKRLGRPMPESVPPDAGNRKRGVTNKAVSNRKLKAELSYDFVFPDFRTGYLAELQRSGTPFHS